jgi:hypothetical protein
MANIARRVLWLCKKFTRAELQGLIAQLQQILAEREPEIPPRDDFRQQHPHDRDFYVDPLAPLSQPPTVTPTPPTWDWQQLCAQYQKKQGRPLAPVRRQGTHKLPLNCRCAHCGAPRDFLYLNDGC